MRVPALMAVALAFGLLGIAPAQAQSFDGVYKGTMRMTEDIILMSSRQPCTPVGTVLPVEFRVTGSTVTVKTQSGSFSGTVSSDGRFSIVTAHRGAAGGARGSREWKGTITGARIEGAYQLQGPGAICRAVFSAKK